MKWHDAKKEWPFYEKDDFLIYNQNDCYDLGYISKDFDAKSEDDSHVFTRSGSRYDKGTAFYWISTNDIPKPKKDE